MCFSKFDGVNPHLWCYRCENYFDMQPIDPEVWVKVAIMYLEGPAARWLQIAIHGAAYCSCALGCFLFLSLRSIRPL